MKQNAATVPNIHYIQNETSIKRSINRTLTSQTYTYTKTGKKTRTSKQELSPTQNIFLIRVSVFGLRPD